MQARRPDTLRAILCLSIVILCDLEIESVVVQGEGQAGHPGDVQEQRVATPRPGRNESIIEYILRLVESIESRLRSALRQQMCALRNDGAEWNKPCISIYAGESSKVTKTRSIKTRTCPHIDLALCPAKWCRVQ